MDDLIGRTFSRLTVVARAVNLNHSVRYECSCSCGKTVTAYKNMLTSGRQKSCGCLRRETTTARSTTHGHKPRQGAAATYNSWANMRARCTRVTHPRYKDWGGRGITVCERWAKFENFLADMGEKPGGMTLERKDNSKGYSPENCVWATPAQQAANTRNFKLTPAVIAQAKALSAEGMTMIAIGRELGLNRHTIAKALF
jgi:hypothetical protein